MEDISNYFYLIFLAISLIFGFLGKKKKKGAENEKSSGSDFITNFLDELDPDGGQRDNRRKAEPVTHQQSEPEPEPAMESSQTNVSDSRRPLSELVKDNDVSKKAEELRQRSRKEIASADTKMDFHKQQSALKLAKRRNARKNHPLDGIDFDIKNAVIYDAILNRPKF